MAAADSKSGLISHGLVAQNKKARHDFAIEDTVEAGIVLEGSEVKALRNGRCNISESYAGTDGDDLALYNAYIPVYQGGASLHFQHEERRPRKLLLHKREIARLRMAIVREGMTLVPLKIYFNHRGIAKLELGLAKGKKKADKRESDKKRSWERDKARIMRARG